MAGKRLRPRKNKAEAEAAILAARRLERPGWSMGRSVMHGEGHIRLDDRRGTARRLCQHTARHRQPQAAPGREKAVLEWVGTTNANGERTQKNTEITKNEAMSSIFTRIIAGEIPSYKVAEDENYYAFLDINPLTKGHTLVVPKMEVDYIFDLDDRDLHLCDRRQRQMCIRYRSDSHTERKRRGFPPRKAQIDAGRVPGNCSKTLRIRSCLQKYNYLYYKRIVGY